MANDSSPCIFFVDDEPGICKEISEFLDNAGFRIYCFTNPLKCLEQLSYRKCDLLVADYKMPEMNGIELMKAVKRSFPWLPVMIITAFGDIPLAVMAMQEGAADFLIKPFDTGTFILKVREILHKNGNINDLINNSLTKMEWGVLVYIIQGKSNKEISILMNRSRRTIESHRATLMEKFNANNVVDLIKQASHMGLVD